MDQVIQVDVAALAFVAGTIIPLVTALAAKLRASSQVKSIITFALSMATGAVVYLQANEGRVTWQGLVTSLVATYLAAGTTYQNLWKPTGAAEAVANIAPDAGVGKPLPAAEMAVSPTPENIQGVVEETFLGIAAFAEAETEGQDKRLVAEQVTTLKGRAVFADEDGTLFVEVA